MKELFNIVSTASLTLPAVEVCAIIIVLTFCLVFRLVHFGLIAAYLFMYRWGWLLLEQKDQSFLVSYLIFGVVVGVLTAISMIRSTHAH